VLEGENKETIGRQLMLFQERVLPDLANNIKCGNSIIGTDFYHGKQMPLFDEEEMYRINAFDWKAEFPEIMKHGGFDAVIGNPPYGALITSDEIKYLSEQFNFQQYSLDTYFLFIEKALTLLKNSTLLGIIIPNTWLLNLQTDKIRSYIFEEVQIEEIVHYRHPVFPQATVDTEIVILRKGLPKPSHKILITIVQKDNKTSQYGINQHKWQERKGKPVNVFERPEYEPLVEKLCCHSFLDHICLITQGTKPFQTGKGKPRQTKEIVKEKPFVSETKKDNSFRPLLRGSLIGKWQNRWNNNYWISFGDWLAEPRYSANFDAVEKIVIRQTGDSLIATLDRHQFVARDNLYTIVSRNEEIRLAYILGLLNSCLLNWYYQKIINPEQGEALAQVKRGHIARLPIRTVNLKHQNDKARHDKMVSLVDHILDLHKQLAIAKLPQKKTIIKRQIEVTDRQIDELVYELYGLTEEEIKIVESA
jgi:adenine-specific DNA-methyltransferase